MSSLESSHIINQPWPESDLEYLGSCPLCGSDKHAVLYDGLRDCVSFCAPGVWTLHRCIGCNCAYLDPRPTPETIGRAYEKYFTHENANQKVSLLKRIKELVLNGYLNRNWGTSLSPASQILAMLLPSSYKAFIDGEIMRHLPRPVEGRLLDVGCGSGQFLLYAQSAGWCAAGFDTDPKAVEFARSKNLDVRLGGIETFIQEANAFDAITVSHVIEHVYNPKELLSNCYRLLKPGGYFWIETPNIDSYGHVEFKSDWLDLDPPRHLSFHTWQSLRRLLSESGFCDIAPLDWRPEYELRYHASIAIKRGQNPMLAKSTLMGKIIGRLVELNNRKDFTKREFITLKATKKFKGDK